MYIRPKKKGSMSISPQQFDHFLVMDFEATCERDTKLKPQEIIEFPCLKVNYGRAYSKLSCRNFVNKREKSVQILLSHQ